MLAALMQLFSSDGYMPHGMCLLWETGLLRLHIWADALIGISYFSMPIALLYFARKRPDFAFSWVLFFFGIFLLACGTTLFFSIWTLWHPTYVLDGLVKALTAAASIPTAILLWLIMPQALALPNLRQLGALNAALQGQITERQLSEIALTDANTKLQEATAKLSHSEREARALNARLSLGTQAGGIGVWDYDIQARAFWWDDRMCDLYGVSKDAATNDDQTWLSRLHVDDRQRAEAVFAEALETGQSYEAEYRIIWPNGDVRTLRTNGKRSTNEAGQSPHLVGVCYDVTDLRQKELAAEREGAKRASERFQRVVEAAP